MPDLGPALPESAAARPRLVSAIVFDSISRLFGRGNARSASPRPAAAPAPSAAPPPRKVVERKPAPAPVGIGARRPLVSGQGALAGFEFHAAALDPRRLRRAEDTAVVTAYLGNLLGAMRLCTTQGLHALAELPLGWLPHCERDEAFTPGMHLLLRPDGDTGSTFTPGASIARLRGLGVRIGWDPDAEGATAFAEAGRPDFAAMRAAAPGDAAAWRRAIAEAAMRWGGVPLVLLDLPDIEAMEAALGPSTLLAACTVASCAVPAKVQALPPQAQRLLRLLNRLLQDDQDNAAVVVDIKSDAALSLRLLHYLNSAGASPGRELDSIEQAVLVLGRDKLYRWIAQMLVRMSAPRPAAEALQALALARARMLEMLARAQGLQNPGGLYLLGLASMLPLLLQCSLDDAQDALCLAPAAVQALQDRGGPWEPHLHLLMALEANDIGRAGPLAVPFGGLEAVLSLWTDAWRPR